MHFERLCAADAEIEARAAFQPPSLGRRQPDQRHAGATPAKLTSLQIQFKTQRPGKGRLVKILSGAAIEPAHLFRQRQVKFVHLAQQHMHRCRVQGGRKTVSGRIQQVAAQQRAFITPVHEIQVAADIALRLIKRRHRQMFGRRGHFQQLTLYPAGQFDVVPQFFFPADHFGNIAEKLNQQTAPAVAHYRRRPLDRHFRPVTMTHHTPLDGQITAFHGTLQNGLNIGPLVDREIKNIQ